jgi:23S rRNA pseudouridine2605 synthase
LYQKPDAEPDTPGPLRLQVYLAHAGLASRRAAEGIIAQGRVRINGRVIAIPGEKVLPGDEVTVDGKAVRTENRLRYLALHKPPLYLCSSADPEGRRLAKDLLPREITERLYNVGRLDYRSSGLILFTNDGDFAARISHPRSGIVKEYEVEATGPIPDEFVRAFREGVDVDGVRYQAEEIERVGRRNLRIALVEGKNREIRRVFSHFHLHPEKLHRIRIGPVLLGDLPEGKNRPLTEEELRALRADTKIEKQE